MYQINEWRIHCVSKICSVTCILHCVISKWDILLKMVLLWYSLASLPQFMRPRIMSWVQSSPEGWHRPHLRLWIVNSPIENTPLHPNHLEISQNYTRMVTDKLSLTEFEPATSLGTCTDFILSGLLIVLKYATNWSGFLIPF